MHQVCYENTQTDIIILFFKKEQNGYDTQKELQFDVQRYKSETGRNRLRHRGPLIWNSLPNGLKKRQNIITFKGQLQRFYKVTLYERAFKMLKNDMCITEIGQAVLEL